MECKIENLINCPCVSHKIINREKTLLRIYSPLEKSNLIDRTFTVLTNLLINTLPVTKREREAYFYYRAGFLAQKFGDYISALENYCEALKLEEDIIDRSFIFYNIALIFTNIGNIKKAIQYYVEKLDLNPEMPQANNNLGIIYHFMAKNAIKRSDWKESSRYLVLVKYHFNRITYYQNSRGYGYDKIYNWISLDSDVAVS